MVFQSRTMTVSIMCSDREDAPLKLRRSWDPYGPPCQSRRQSARGTSHCKRLARRVCRRPPCCKSSLSPCCQSGVTETVQSQSRRNFFPVCGAKTSQRTASAGQRTSISVSALFSRYRPLSHKVFGTEGVATSANLHSLNQTIQRLLIE